MGQNNWEDQPPSLSLSLSLSVLAAGNSIGNRNFHLLRPTRFTDSEALKDVDSFQNTASLEIIIFFVPNNNQEEVARIIEVMKERGHPSQEESENVRIATAPTAVAVFPWIWDIRRPRRDGRHSVVVVLCPSVVLAARRRR